VKRRKKLIAVVALSVLALGAGAFAVLAPAGEGKGPAAVVEVGLGEPFVVNLRDAGRFARAELVLKVAEGAVAGDGGHGASDGPVLTEHAAARDAVIATVGRYTYGRLLSPAGRNRLRAQLRRTIGKAIGAKVAEVLFVDFAVQ
jgi:flagellar basal body-associated protein FliL